MKCKNLRIIKKQGNRNNGKTIHKQRRVTQRVVLSLLYKTLVSCHRLTAAVFKYLIFLHQCNKRIIVFYIFGFIFGFVWDISFFYILYIFIIILLIYILSNPFITIFYFSIRKFVFLSVVFFAILKKKVKIFFNCFRVSSSHFEFYPFLMFFLDFVLRKFLFEFFGVFSILSRFEVFPLVRILWNFTIWSTL